MRVDMDAYTVEFSGPCELFMLRDALGLAEYRLDEVTGQPAPIEDNETEMIYRFVVDARRALFEMLSQP